MGFGIKELAVILVIVLLLFGTKKLRNIGSDLGGAIRGFRNSMKEGDDSADDEADKAEDKDALQNTQTKSEAPTAAKDKVAD